MSKETNQNGNEHISRSAALDDEQRVKVLSPGMLVAKRFFRNKLAIVGLVIIVTMFLFSFVGGILSPYSEDQVFRTVDEINKDFAGVTLNQDYQYAAAPGKEFPSLAGAKMILAINNGETEFTAKDVTYSLIEEGNEFYQIVGLTPVAEVITLKGKSTVKAADGGKVSAEVTAGFEEAVKAKKNTFTAEGMEYYIVRDGKKSLISVMDPIAIASKMLFSPAQSGQTFSYEFRLNAQRAMAAGETRFTAEGETYTLEANPDAGASMVVKGSEHYAYISPYSVQAVGGEFLSLEFKMAAEKAVAENASSLRFEEGGKETSEYTIIRKNMQYLIRSKQQTQVNDTFASPSRAHWLGTDGNGMDLLTRLMYGGRISLMIGFVAVFLEILIGVIIGGLAGYFGGWMDTMLMRVVDIFICIPSFPLYLILGSLMDYYRVDPKIRIFFLCGIIGLLSWTSTARMVRGQILSLREQEFMVATEATGIRVSRRIFKHLIPNVIPQLIVIATMGLGDIIIMEATLSFLGLGVKFPFASWGNIVNAVNDVYVLTNFWFVWIPAGFLILITVLGFNFVGDGLRDAFDPKMKR